MYGTEERKTGRRIPQEAHFNTTGEAAGMCLNPRLVRAEDNPNLARPVTGLIRGCLAIGKAPPMSGD